MKDKFMSNILFSISIPTYNRRILLERNLLHLEQINFDKKKFEVLVVDDGSTDGTDIFIEEFLKKSSLQIRYFKKQNGGKFTAVNHAISEAKGYFFINSDSDDYLDKNCLRNIVGLWESIEADKIDKIAGIIGQNLNSKNNKIQGDLFPKDRMFSDPIIMRFKYNVKGDKFPCFKLSVIKEFNFPVINNVRFVPESYIFYGISSQFEFLYSNIVFQHCDYQEDGLSNVIQRYRLDNSYGCFLVYEKYVKLFKPSKTLKGYIRNYLNYVRFSYHINQKTDLKRVIDYLLFPFGYLLYLKDSYYKE